MKANIAPALRELALPLAKLTEHPRNARQGDVGAIVESLKRFGQQKPIVAQKKGDGPHVVVAGNHLLKAARELGWPEVAVNVVAMSDRDATAFLVADNRTQELGSYDRDVLASILSELARDDNLAATGYDGDDVDALLAELAGPDREVGDAAHDDVTVVWGVVIDLDSEQDQVTLLTELASRGLRVRALMS